MTKHIFSSLLFWGVFGVLPIFAQEPSDTTIYTIVEEMPFLKICVDSSLTYEEKKVCSDRELLKYIYNNLKLPPLDDYSECCISIISFVINQEGKIQNIKVIKSIHSTFDAVIIDIVKNFPEWIPGRHRGKNVAVKMNLPIRINIGNK